MQEATLGYTCMCMCMCMCMRLCPSVPASLCLVPATVSTCLVCAQLGKHLCQQHHMAYHGGNTGAYQMRLLTHGVAARPSAPRVTTATQPTHTSTTQCTSERALDSDLLPFSTLPSTIYPSSSFFTACVARAHLKSFYVSLQLLTNHASQLSTPPSRPSITIRHDSFTSIRRKGTQEHAPCILLGWRSTSASSPCQ